MFGYCVLYGGECDLWGFVLDNDVVVARGRKTTLTDTMLDWTGYVGRGLGPAVDRVTAGVNPRPTILFKVV